MKKYFMPLMLCALMMPSCAITSEDGQEVSLEQASDIQYEDLKQRVHNSSIAAGALLQIGLASEPELRADVVKLADSLAKQIQDNKLEGLQSGDVVAWVLSQFGEKLSLEEKELAVIQGSARLIDAATGGIDLDLGGELTKREKELLITLLDGLVLGLQ